MLCLAQDQDYSSIYKKKKIEKVSKDSQIIDWQFNQISFNIFDPTQL